MTEERTAHVLLIVGSLSLLREILAFWGVHVGANYFGNVKAVMQPNQSQPERGTRTECADELVEPELDELSWNCLRGASGTLRQHNPLRLAQYTNTLTNEVHQIHHAKKITMKHALK